MGASAHIDEERGRKNDEGRRRQVEHLSSMRTLEDQNQNQNGFSLALSSTNLRRRKEESGSPSGSWMDSSLGFRDGASTKTLQARVGAPSRVSRFLQFSSISTPSHVQYLTEHIYPYPITPETSQARYGTKLHPTRPTKAPTAQNSRPNESDPRDPNMKFEKRQTCNEKRTFP